MAGPEELDSFKRATAGKLRGLRCPMHHRAPQLCFAGASLREVTIRLSGCCGRLMDLANAAIAGRVSEDEPGQTALYGLPAERNAQD